MKDQTTSGADWLHEFAAQHLRGGSPGSEIIKRMMRSGVDPVRAAEVVRRAEQKILSDANAGNSRNTGAKYRGAIWRRFLPRPTLRSVLFTVISIFLLAAIVRNILVPPTPLPQSFRPENSIIGKELSLPGGGSLKITNDTADDGVVFLVGEAGTLTAAYVRAHETFQIGGVPGGTYSFYYVLGSGWNGRTFNYGTHPM